MDTSVLYEAHLELRKKSYAQVLSSLGFDHVVLGSGVPFTYFADDQDAVFRPHPHFSHWCPERSPHQLLQVSPGEKPRLVRFRPKDFWHDHCHDDEGWWSQHFDVIDVDSPKALWDQLAPKGRIAFLGAQESSAQERGWEANPKNLLAALDWERGLKSDYELECVREANRVAAVGHRRARAAFSSGGSELDIHLEFLAGVEACEGDLPYSSIVGLDEKAAVLHYQYKRKLKPGSLLLIDAGATFLGYASDITRTYVRESAPADMKDLLIGMDRLQQNLCAAVAAKKSYVDLHASCHRQISQLLLDCQVIKGASCEQIVDEGLSRTFFPHGLGHNLGLQVHDVSGLQKNSAGDPCDRDPRFPSLRTARSLREREIITIEPGLYFIPMLLDAQRETKESQYFNWPLIDQLQAFGGIRIEDNIFIGANQAQNLTREFLGSELIV